MNQTIYISAYLKKTIRGKHIAAELKSILGDSLKEIPDPLHAKNEWCRDYMPVKASDGTHVLFRYMPSYLMGSIKYEKTIPDQLTICKALDIKVKDNMVQEIILDGGAIEIFSKKGIISDRVFYDNYPVWNNGSPLVYHQIKDLLKLDELIVVPAHPWDFTGHVDGMVRFINESTVLVNDDSEADEIIDSEYDLKTYKLWQKNFKKSLENSGLTTIPLTCTALDNDDDDSAEGIYMNFLKLTNRIIMPSFDSRNKYNKAAKSILEKAYGLPVHEIEALELAMKGGIINCVTWNE